MRVNPLQTAQFREMMQRHIAECIGFLFENNEHFAVACETRHILFDPPLPEHISMHFQETVLFVLTGYTYDVAQIDTENLYFEAGFGEENFGSNVTVPLLAIKQIFVRETPILLNVAEPAPQLLKADKEEQELRIADDDSKRKRSMEALLNNPENQKLLKKKE